MDWPGCANVRDVGGLPTTDGGRIRSGTLIRSDSPHWLTERGCAAVRSAGVRRILDLRSTEEAELDPSPFAGEAAYRLLPLIDPAREHERLGRRATILAMLTAVDERHGGIAEYLCHHGVSTEQQARLRARLCE
ncbi:MAG: tyrosine-protein phosphatase [Geodermatophilaceae bacterium]